MKSPLTIFILLQIMDLATTLVALGLGGNEQNPMIAILMAANPVRGLLLSKVIAIGLATLGAHMQKQRGIWCANAVFSIIVLWNLSVITKLALAS